MQIQSIPRLNNWRDAELNKVDGFLTAEILYVFKKTTFYIFRREIMNACFLSLFDCKTT